MFDYCGEDCQQEHWLKVHKKHCKYLVVKKVLAMSEHDEVTCLLCRIGADPTSPKDRVLPCTMSCPPPYWLNTATPEQFWTCWRFLFLVGRAYICCWSKYRGEYSKNYSNFCCIYPKNLHLYCMHVNSLLNTLFMLVLGFTTIGGLKLGHNFHERWRLPKQESHGIQLLRFYTTHIKLE